MVNDSFRAIASPVRRRIVERLASGPATVGEATSGLAAAPGVTSFATRPSPLQRRLM